MEKPPCILDDTERDAYRRVGVEIPQSEVAFTTSAGHVVGVSVPSWYPVEVSSAHDGENAFDAFVRLNNKYCSGELGRLELLLSLGCDLYAADFGDGRTRMVVRKHEAKSARKSRRLTASDTGKLRKVVEWLRADFDARMLAAFKADPLGCFVNC